MQSACCLYKAGTLFVTCHRCARLAACACAVFWRNFSSLLLVYGLVAFWPLVSVAAELDKLHGKASWYGAGLYGKRTANGEILGKNTLTAAHRTVPFGTVLRIYNLNNHQQILVRVNDRGPYAKGRIVDVSRRAADYLKMTRSGVANVALEMVSNTRGEPLNRDSSFYLHIADVKSLSRADMLSSQLQQSKPDLDLPVRTLFSLQKAPPAYAVCLGPYATFEQAERLFIEFEKRKIASLGIIEAPTLGGDIPRHIPPFKWAKNIRPKKKRIHGLTH